jgi:hypothetical protein
MWSLLRVTLQSVRYCRMRIGAIRSGGFAGTRQPVTVDTTSKSLIFGATNMQRPLTAKELETIESLAKAAMPLVTAHDMQTTDTSLPDRFTYDVMIEHDGRQWTVRTDDSDPSSPLARLSRYIVGLGRASASLR